MNESSWISVKDRLPDSTRRYLISARGDVTEAIFHTGSNEWEACSSRHRVTAEHWMPLPEPPPKPDAFEEFWGDCGKADGQENYRYVGWAQKSPIVAPVFKQTAKCIWDAAIASTKQSVV